MSSTTRTKEQRVPTEGWWAQSRSSNLGAFDHGLYRCVGLNQLVMVEMSKTVTVGGYLVDYHRLVIWHFI